jgi:AcrR family transcriptional regulator
MFCKCALAYLYGIQVLIFSSWAIHCTAIVIAGIISSMGVKVGTAVREKGQERVETILEAALSLLIEQGYSGLSLRKISASAGIQLGHVQYYFPIKQDLLRTMLDRWLTGFQTTVNEHVSQAESEGAPALDRLLKVIDLSLRDMRTPMGSIMIWEVWALAPRDPFVEQFMERLYKDLRTVYRKLIQEHNPTLTTQRAHLIAGSLSSLVEGASLYLGYGKRRERNLTNLDKEILRSARAIVESNDDR